jgi:hypothetical protein
MSVAAAIRITSADEALVIDHAAAFARQRCEPCFVISIVDVLPYGASGEGEQMNVERNLARIHAAEAAPVMQEGDDVGATLLSVSRSFGVGALFLRSGKTAERLLQLDPPFDLVVVGSG